MVLVARNIKQMPPPPFISSAMVINPFSGGLCKPPESMSLDKQRAIRPEPFTPASLSQTCMHDPASPTDAKEDHVQPEENPRRR
jgi:hypothetical protein